MNMMESIKRREFLRRALAGTTLVAMGGGLYQLLSDDLTKKAQAERLPDGRSRLPPGQRVIQALKPMGGEPGSPLPSQFRLRVHGEVDKPLDLNFSELTGIAPKNQTCDVHCVTGWSLLDSEWTGISLAELLHRAGVRPAARHVIFEAAHGYTANIRLSHAIKANSMIAWAHGGRPLSQAHGAPVRALIPDLYFWKSAKWIEGIKVVSKDEPGYWEVRGYNNHADPWKEERYA